MTEYLLDRALASMEHLNEVAEATKRFARHGVTAFLQKPYTARSLAEKVANVVG